MHRGSVGREHVEYLEGVPCVTRRFDRRIYRFVYVSERRHGRPMGVDVPRSQALDDVDRRVGSITATQTVEWIVAGGQRPEREQA